jgi:hypothetical protein
MAQPSNRHSDKIPDAAVPAQAWLLRNVLFPAFCKATSDERATALFRREGAKLEAVCAQFTPDQFTQRVSIRPFLGLDERACTWSAAMVVEHVTLEGELVGQILTLRGRDHACPILLSATAVRPTGARGLRALADFSAWHARYLAETLAELPAPLPRHTHEHPWLGELDCHAWHCFAALHLRVHRRQLAAIRAHLDDTAAAARPAAPDLLFEPSPESPRPGM